MKATDSPKAIIVGLLAGQLLACSAAWKRTVEASATRASGTTANQVTATPGKGLRAIVYKGPGACEGCETATRDFLVSLGFDTSYVGPSDLTNPAIFQGVTVYGQPGGDDTALVTNAVGENVWSQVQTNMRNFVEGGGIYLGICLGGYLADSAEGDLGLMPGTVTAFKKTQSNYVLDQVISVNWLPTTSVRKMYFQEGPALPNIGKVYATYTDGTPAMLIHGVGKGKLVLSGPHFEATSEWYKETEGRGGPDTDGLDASLGLKLMQDALSGQVGNF